jgi:hypothetical protein
MEEREKIGKIATDILSKSQDKNTIIDVQREATKDYLTQIDWAIKHAKKQVDCSHLLGGGRGHEACAAREALVGDMYVVVLTKKEALLQNVLRLSFHTRITCPTPDYNQTVFFYHDKTGDLEYLWTVPDEQTCAVFYDNAVDIVPAERQLLGFILDFLSGALLAEAKKRNGESKLIDGIVLERN